MILDFLFGVWTPAAVASAVVAGLGLGYTMVGWIILNPAYSSLGSTATRYGLLVAGASIIGGAFFWGGQVIGAYAGGDELWWRILSRFTIWLLYAVCLGIGAAWSFHRDHAQRVAKARERAKREFEA